MNQLPFVWLGANRAGKRGVGPKGSLLDGAARAGLPVPSGGILLDDFYHLALETGLLIAQNGRIVAPDPDWLHETIYQGVRFPRLKRSAAVRAAFSDTGQRDGPRVAARLNIDVNDARLLTDALCRMWSPVVHEPDSLRRDVIIQEMVKRRQAGTACSEPSYQDDLIHITTGESTSAQVAPESMLLPQLQGWEASATTLPPFARRLQKLLRGVRRTFGPGPWQLEWVDDGEICWLLQLHPLDRTGMRQEDYAEFEAGELAGSSSPFTTSLLIAAGEALLDYLRRYDRHLPAGRTLVVAREGRPLINVSLLADILRAWGLPTTPAFKSLGISTGIETKTRYHRLVRRAVPLLRWQWAQRRAAVSAGHLATEIAGRVQRRGAHFSDNVALFQELYTAFIREVFLLGAAISEGPDRLEAQEAWRRGAAAAADVLTGCLLAGAERAAGRGQLPQSSDIWLLEAAEVKELDRGKVYDDRFMAGRRAAVERL